MKSSLFMAMILLINADPSLETLDYAAKRTVEIGNCSAVILPPQKDTAGKWHWYVGTAAHCATGRGRQVQIIYPEKSRKFSAREIIRDRRADVMILEIVFKGSGPHEPLPYAELADPATVSPGQEVLVTGFPARFQGKMVWKAGKITRVGNRVTVDQAIWSGNSGGPLWVMGGKRLLVCGVASTSSSLRGNGGSSGWGGPRALHDVYHEACRRTLGHGRNWDPG